MVNYVVGISSDANHINVSIGGGLLFDDGYPIVGLNNVSNLRNAGKLPT